LNGASAFTARGYVGVGVQPGIVLDPFMGSGTTALVARQLGRRFIGIELKEECIPIAERRLQELPRAGQGERHFVSSKHSARACKADSK
jgi:DNA modification methylase